VSEAVARGFLSKQTEDQQAEAERKRALRESGSGREPTVDPRRRSLELARTDVRRRLETARDERLREQLRRALDDIESRLEKLDSPPGG
jgi:hypothetical protein